MRRRGGVIGGAGIAYTVVVQYKASREKQREKFAVKIQERIENRLKEALRPSVLQVENESRNHNVPPDSETHFKVVVVSPEFSGKRQVQRHQQVYGLLQEEMAGPVHALALHTYAPDEWEDQAGVPSSPDCMGGKAREP